MAPLAQRFARPGIGAEESRRAVVHADDFLHSWMAGAMACGVDLFLLTLCGYMTIVYHSYRGSSMYPQLYIYMYVYTHTYTLILYDHIFLGLLFSCLPTDASNLMLVPGVFSKALHAPGFTTWMAPVPRNISTAGRLRIQVSGVSGR